MNELFTILAITSIQGFYDFLGWFYAIGINQDYPPRLIYRIIKETLDFPVTIYILVWVLQLPEPVIDAFYIFKWWHGCDSFYNIYEFIVTNHQATVWGSWRFWTPLGLLRTNWWGWCILKGRTEAEFNGFVGLFINQAPGKKFSKGMISIQECWVQTAIGFALAIAILQFKPTPVTSLIAWLF